MFTTFSKTMSDPSTRNRMVAYTTQASASTSMKGSSQARTPARCNRWAYVDISISLGQRPGKRWPNGKLVSGQECTHTSMALPAHARTRRARIPLPGAPARFGAFCDRHRGRKITRTVQDTPSTEDTVSALSPRACVAHSYGGSAGSRLPPHPPPHTHTGTRAHSFHQPQIWGTIGCAGITLPPKFVVWTCAHQLGRPD